MRRDYPDRPIVGVGAIIFDEGQVVLVRRGRPPAYGEWSLPGGAVELGETLEEALIREVSEEVGLEVEVMELIAVLDRVFLDEEGRVKYHYVLMDFLCRSIGGTLQASSDVLSSSRVPLEALAEYQLRRQTREVIDRAHQRMHGEAVSIYVAQSITAASK